MDPFETECPRCARMKGKATQVPPQPVGEQQAKPMARPTVSRIVDNNPSVRIVAGVYIAAAMISGLLTIGLAFFALACMAVSSGPHIMPFIFLVVVPPVLLTFLYLAGAIFIFSHSKVGVYLCTAGDLLLVGGLFCWLITLVHAFPPVVQLLILIKTLPLLIIAVVFTLLILYQGTREWEN